MINHCETCFAKFEVKETEASWRTQCAKCYREYRQSMFNNYDKSNWNKVASMKIVHFATNVTDIDSNVESPINFEPKPQPQPIVSQSAYIPTRSQQRIEKLKSQIKVNQDKYDNTKTDKSKSVLQQRIFKQIDKLRLLEKKVEIKQWEASLVGLNRLFKEPITRKSKKQIVEPVCKDLSIDDDFKQELMDRLKPIVDKENQMSVDNIRNGHLVIKQQPIVLPVIQPVCEQIEDSMQEEQEVIAYEEIEDDEQAVEVYREAMKYTFCTKVCGRRIKKKIRPTGKLIKPPHKKIHISTSLKESILEDIKMHRYKEASNKLKSFINKLGQSNKYQVELRTTQKKKFSSKIGSLKIVIGDVIYYLHKPRDSGQEDDPFEDISIFEYIRELKRDRRHMVRGGQHIIAMNNHYVLISPQSETNCFYHCLVYWRLLIEKQYEKMIDNDYIQRSAKDIKLRYGKNDKDHTTIDDIQTISNHYGINFTCYDNLFNILENGEIKPTIRTNKERKSSKLIGQTIKLQFRNGHCLLMVPKNMDTDFTKMYEKHRQTKNTECKPIIPRKYNEKTKERIIMTYDLECFKINKELGTQIPFAVGLCSNFNIYDFSYEYQQFYGSQCIQQFLDYLSDINTTSEVYLYAHNGAKYDIAIVNEYLLRNKDFIIEGTQFLELNGGVINQTVFNKHNTKIVFRDSCRIFAGSLDGLCRDLKPKYMKQSNHKFNFDDLNSENVYGEYRSEIEDYLKHDCLSLAEIMIKFRNQLIADESIGIDICDCYTSATLAKKLFFKRYYPKSCYIWFDNKYIAQYIHELSREIDLDIRAGYFGGRCDIHAYGTFKDVYYYDFTSLYPYVGSKYNMPIGSPIRVDGSDININQFFGFIRCKVTTNPEHLPLHGFKNDHKLVFGNHEGTEIMLFSEEIKKGLELGYKYEFLHGYKFEKTMLLKGIMEEGFKRKADSKKNGEPIMEKTWKIVINSAYGFFGLRWMDKRGIKFLTGDQLDAYMEEGKVYNYNQLDDDQYIVDMESDLFEIGGKNIAVASAVTSYARMTLYELLHDIQKKGEQVYYFDTDSVITSCNIKKYEYLQVRYQWDNCGDELGSVKNECLDKIKSKLTPQQLQQQIELDGGELKFDECQILAPKVYSLRKRLITGQVIEIAKMKGVKETSYDMQTKLLNNEYLRSNVTQFVAGKRAYMKDQNIEGRVNVINVEKLISQVHLNIKRDKYGNVIDIESTDKLRYDKGILINGIWYPHKFIKGVKQCQ